MDLGYLYCSNLVFLLRDSTHMAKMFLMSKRIALISQLLNQDLIGQIFLLFHLFSILAGVLFGLAGVFIYFLFIFSKNIVRIHSIADCITFLQGGSNHFAIR